MTLTREQLMELRQQLEVESADLRHRLDETEAYGTKLSMRESLGELSLYDNHPADIGDELFERSKDLSLRDHDSLQLEDIREAFERMDQGTYGTCLRCGKDIALERLQAEPTARFCMDCEQGKRKEEVIISRPVEEDFLYPGFGRTDMDDNPWGQTAFDGEDSWQQVARFGTSNSASDFYDHATLSPNGMFIDSDEPVGYVEDLEEYLTADIFGNPTGFARNEAFRRDKRHEGTEDFLKEEE